METRLKVVFFLLIWCAYNFVPYMGHVYFYIMEYVLLEERTVKFAKEILNLCKELEYQKEVVISRQLMRSGTAIGAACAEAKYAESPDDFIHKMKLAGKEASETRYWFSVAMDSIKIKAELLDELLIIQKIISKSMATAIRNRDLKRQNQHANKQKTNRPGSNDQC